LPHTLIRSCSSSVFKTQPAISPARDFDLHAIRFLTQLDQGARNMTGDIIERQVVYFIGSIAQTTCDLLTDGEYDLGMGVHSAIQICVAYLSGFTGGASPAPGGTLFGLFEYSLSIFPKKSHGVQVSDHDFLIII
jgi:hypothetical protein